MGEKRGQVTVFIIIGIILITSFFLISFFVEKRAESDFNAEELLSDSLGHRFDKASIEEYYLACIEDLAKDSLFLYSPNRLISFIEQNVGKCSREVEEYYPYIDFKYGKAEVKVKKILDDNIYDINVNYLIGMEGKEERDFLSDFNIKVQVKKQHKLKLNENNQTIGEQEINILDGKIKLIIPNGTKATLYGDTVDIIDYEIVKDENQNIVIDFKPSGTVFDKRLELKFSYDGLEFPKDFKIKRDLRVGLYDNKYGKFMVAEGSYVNTTTKEIVSRIVHFSKFTWGVVRFEGECDNGVGWDYSKFYELVNETFNEIMTVHTNGTVNETVVELGIINLMIEANGYNQTWFNFTHLYWAEENLTSFSIFANFSNMTIPLSHMDSTSKSDEDCNGSVDLKIDQEFDWMPPNQLWVSSGSKSKNINIDKPGRYAVFGQVSRVEFGDACQDREEFHIEINQVYGNTSEDDPSDCKKDHDGVEYLGQFDLNQGINTVNMVHTGTSGHSVGILFVYITYLNNTNATYFWVDNDGNELRFGYQKVLPKVKSLSLDVEVIGTTTDVGFMSLFEYNDKLYAGTYASNPKIYSYPEWKEEVMLTGAGESVFAFEEYKGNLYAITESRGYLYRSEDGKNFKKIFISPNNLGLGITKFQGSLFTTFTTWGGASGIGPMMYKSVDGNKFSEMTLFPPRKELGCEVYGFYEFKNKLSLSSFCKGFSQTKIYSSDGNSWIHKETFNGVKVFNKVVMNNKSYGYKKVSGKTTIFEYDGITETIILETEIPYKHMVGLNNDIYILTNKCWKCASGGSVELYRLDLQTKKLTQLYTFGEPEGPALRVYNGSIYVATKDHSSNNGKVYKVDVNGESSGEWSDDPDFDWSKVSWDDPNPNPRNLYGDHVANFSIVSGLKFEREGNTAYFDIANPQNWHNPTNSVNCAIVSCWESNGGFTCKQWDWCAVGTGKWTKHMGDGWKHSSPIYVFIHGVRQEFNKERTNIIKIH